jgi:hypothetical protein
VEGIRKFANAFVRDGDGSWFCRAPAHFLGPYGPMTVTPGVTYRRGEPIDGYDIARWLDEWESRQQAPIEIAFL